MADRHDLHRKRSPRAVAPAEGATSKEQPMPADPTIHEARRITAPVARIAPEVLEEFGISRARQLSGHIEDARRELMEGLKLIDRPEDRDLHVWVGQIVCTIDDLREHLAKREES